MKVTLLVAKAYNLVKLLFLFQTSDILQTNASSSAGLKAVCNINP